MLLHVQLKLKLRGVLKTVAGPAHLAAVDVDVVQVYPLLPPGGLPKVGREHFAVAFAGKQPT